MRETWDPLQESVTTTRLMCWAHTSRALDRSQQLAAIRAVDKVIANKILEDIHLLQWSVQNEESFRAVFRLLVSKHCYPDQPELNNAVQAFFEYMRGTWVESEEFRWFEGAHPFGPGHNNSLEGINKSIKENQTFRLKLAMGELVKVTLRLVSEMSKDSDDVLFKPRKDIIKRNNDGKYKFPDSLQIKTKGYQ